MSSETHRECVQDAPSPSPEAKAKVPLIAHVMCGWPFLLVAIGGAIGGALGGAAYVANLAIYKSELPVLAKVALIITIGLAAIGMWAAIGTLIQLAWP